MEQPPSQPPAIPPLRPANPPVSGGGGHVVPGLSARYSIVRRVGLFLLDTVVLFAALGLAYQIGFFVQPDRFAQVYYYQFLVIVPFLTALRLLLLSLSGLYRGFTRYTGIYELTNIVLACLAGTVVLTVFNLVNVFIPDLGPWYPKHISGEYILRVPWSVVEIDLLLSINGLAGIRLARRIIGERLTDLRHHERRRVLIIGAGDAGEHIARNMLKVYRDRFLPVAFIDPDAALVGRRIHGIPVVGTLERTGEFCRRYRVDTVVIALPRAAPRLLRSLIDEVQQLRLEFKIVPDLDAMIEGRVEISQLRSVEIEDLLGRPPVEVGDQTGRSCIAGRCVLVTGAGGSIGSELSAQALEHRPGRLLLLGRGENSIYDINHALGGRARQLAVPLEPIVGDVRDAALVEAVFNRFHPQVVLHAAAHKHVHLMEAQPAEAIKNNVLGTRLVAQAAIRHAVERFIMISTDKAVRPTGVMGASKRVAELIVTALDREGTTRFISVRFGNVLGSRGSVIPLFRRQIAAGGPVTVTHPEVTRYFMTIPEAVSLVLEAGTQGQGGEVFLLDMGEPVKIVDLARQLITLSGLEPGRDITIEFTGLRPGEKLFEELLTSEENRQPTGHPKIFRSPRTALAWGDLATQITHLETLAQATSVDEAAIRSMLRQLIPDYQGL